MSEGEFTRVFRAIHMPPRRRAAENAINGAPVNVQPGELIYDATQNKLYAGQNNNTVLEVSGGGGTGGNGNPFDQDLNTTDSVTFNSLAMPNGTQLTVGSFDNMTSGQNGIALHCTVGYELNWQGGRLRSVFIGDVAGAPQTLYVDSPLEFAGPGVANMQVSALGLTFPDGTQQTTAAGALKSDPTGITGATAITNIVKISQTNYDALVVKDPATFYIIDG